MCTEYVERVKDYWKMSHGNSFVKMVENEGLEDEVKKSKTLPLHLGALVLWNCKRNMNNFVLAMKGFYTND